jgi:predicted acyltransferase
MLPAAALALMGALAAGFIRTSPRRGTTKVLLLGAAGAASLGLGLLWGLSFPVVKAIWSSSYILTAGGVSLLLLAAFYLVCDAMKLRWLAYPFLPIGWNAITIYVARNFVDFEQISRSVFGGAARHAGEGLGPVVITSGVLVIEWVILWFLARHRIFLRV